MTTKRILFIALLAFGLAISTVAMVGAQDKPASPPGSTATQIGDGWIEVEYSRPILRGRTDIFGSGDEYGKKLNAGAPVWRAGANATTRIKTEHDLEINGVKVPAGEYSFFIELGAEGWNAILSTQEFMKTPDRAKIAEGVLWGSYGYDASKNVVTAPMTVQTGEQSIDQLTYVFIDVSEEGGALAVAWHDQVGVLPFTIAK